ncbi:MAG: SRPBCC family protein [Anaerolineae bacterium]
MTRIERDIIINAPVGKVFSFMDAVEKQPEWLPSMIEVRDISNWPGLGTRWRWVFKMAGVRFEGESLVTEYLQNKKIVVETKGGIVSVWTWLFRPHRGATKVYLTIEYEVPGGVLGRLADRFLVEKMNQKEAEAALANIKSMVESGIV